MKYYIDFWKRAFDFKGVASRPQYWFAVLANVIVLFILTLIFGTAEDGGNITVTDIYTIIMIIPSISIGVRRLHDHNRSGWFYLISFIPLVGGIINLVFMLQRTIKENNVWRMYDVQRGYIKDDLFDQPLAR